MTTGGGPRSAPSASDPGNPEWRRMSQGDVLCDGLLARGIAVLRPDYEGIGGPGIHPYLIGTSLAESMTAMMDARATFAASLGDAWVAAGHSEGAVAALWASVGAEPRRAQLRGTAAFAPVTRLDLSLRTARALPLRIGGFGVLPALIGLMIRGGAAVDPRIVGALGRPREPVSHRAVGVVVVGWPGARLDRWTAPARAVRSPRPGVPRERRGEPRRLSRARAR